MENTYKYLIQLFEKRKSTKLFAILDNFLYTNDAGNTMFWTLPTISNELCVSAYVSKCDDCYINFRVRYDKQLRKMQEISLKSTPWNQSKWKYQKFFIRDIETGTIDLFVETGLKNVETKDEVFWALDQIRVCNLVGQWQPFF